jgi:transcriptional regulator with XRE-family HTH domain
MQLETYLEKNGLSLRDFADRIGVANAGVVSKYANRLQVPRPKIMAAIVRETNGSVQPNDFYPVAAAE